MNRELEVLNILKVFLELCADAFELFERTWHVVLEIGDRFGSAHTGDDVFTLRVDQEFAIKDFFARSRVTRKCNARSRLVARVTVNHRLHIDGGAPLGGNVVLAAIDNRAVVHPRTEHSTDSSPKLLPDILRKFGPRAFLD